MKIKILLALSLTCFSNFAYAQDLFCTADSGQDGPQQVNLEINHPRKFATIQGSGDLSPKLLKLDLDSNGETVMSFSDDGLNKPVATLSANKLTYVFLFRSDGILADEVSETLTCRNL